MRSYLVLTESGPLLTVTSAACTKAGPLRKMLTRRGFSKFIAYEIPVDYLHELYGVPFEVIAGDIKRGEHVRVLDFNGAHIFNRVSLSKLGRARMVEH